MFARIIFSILALAAFAATFSANAQSSWSLTNISNATLQFDTFDPARGSWKRQTIYPNQLTRYTMSHDSGKFRIETRGRGFVEYRVLTGRSYTVGWDQNKGVWDLKFASSDFSDSSDSSGQQGGNRKQPRNSGSYQLLNTSNESLSFETFDPARGTWRKQSIFPNENKTFTMSPGNNVGRIRIGTDGRGYVEYDVRVGWQYKMLFDSRKGVWDLRTLARN